MGEGEASHQYRRDMETGDWRLEGAVISHLCLVLVLLLGLLAAGLFGDRADGGLVDDEACPALLLVPLEASEVGLVQFIIGLGVLARVATVREW